MHLVQRVIETSILVGESRTIFCSFCSLLRSPPPAINHHYQHLDVPVQQVLHADSFDDIDIRHVLSIKDPRVLWVGELSPVPKLCGYFNGGPVVDELGANHGANGQRCVEADYGYKAEDPAVV